MKLYRTESGIFIEHETQHYFSSEIEWDDLINRDHLFNLLLAEIINWTSVKEEEISRPLAPIVSQEIWAAGVTYLRSMHARVEESKDSGGATFYDKVYDAERPEIFFKANAQRTVGHNGLVRIRKDSTWNVPEPELTLFIATSGNIVGYTIGNDMSSRSIEGENPLYLPQAKMYEGCASLGPCIYVPERPIDQNTNIEISIERGDVIMYQDLISIAQMKREHNELVSFLFRECKFPFGCFLMTGTGIVPPSTFTLAHGDQITITIDNIGTLINRVG